MGLLTINSCILWYLLFLFSFLVFVLLKCKKCRVQCTWESFICMLANTCKKPTTASHSLLWARLCWFPIHGPWGQNGRRWWERQKTKYLMKVINVYIADLTVLTENSHSCLNILSEWVEYLFSYRQSFGEVDFSSLINDVFARVVPIEVTDRFLKEEDHMSKRTKLAMTNDTSDYINNYSNGNNKNGGFISVVSTPEDGADSQQCW